MGWRGAAIAALALAFFLGLTVLMPSAWLPSAATGATGGGGHGPPASDIKPLANYTAKEVVDVQYTSYMHGRDGGGDDDDDDGTEGTDSIVLQMSAASGTGVAPDHDDPCRKAKDWTELFYRLDSDEEWARYAPPWNPCGRWVGTKVPGSDHVVEGTIPFDSFYTGGETEYQFATVAVHHRHDREPLPDSEKARTFVDYHAPQLFVASPVADSWTNQDTLRWEARDEVTGVEAINVSVDGSEPIVIEQPQGSRDLGVTEGTHAVRVTATDRAGNVAEVDFLFHFDPSAPTLVITSPVRGSYLSSTDVSIDWTIGEEGAPMLSLRLSVDASAPIDLPTDATSYALGEVAERTHVATMLAVDAAGNIATESLAFTVDATRPMLTVVAPTRPFVNTRDLQLYWVGSDATSGIDHYELSLDDGAIVSLQEAAGYSFANVREGPHSVRLRAYDRAGNVAERLLTVTVDTTAPVVSLTAPERGTTVYGSVQIAWTAQDEGSGVDSISVIFDGGTPIIATGGSSVSVSSPAVGPHYAVVRVTDRAGNMAEAGAPFAYGGTAGPGATGISALDFGLIMLLLGAIAIVAAYIAIRRRRRRQTP